jgi:hypothetical protein
MFRACGLFTSTSQRGHTIAGLQARNVSSEANTMKRHEAEEPVTELRNYNRLGARKKALSEAVEVVLSKADEGKVLRLAERFEKWLYRTE